VRRWTSARRPRWLRAFIRAFGACCAFGTNPQRDRQANGLVVALDGQNDSFPCCVRRQGRTHLVERGYFAAVDLQNDITNANAGALGWGIFAHQFDAQLSGGRIRDQTEIAGWRGGCICGRFRFESFARRLLL